MNKYEIRNKICYYGAKTIFYEIKRNPVIINRDNWKCRESTLYFYTEKGAIDFKFYQGIALENKPSFFEIMHCIFQDKQYLNLNLDDFLEEFGYTHDLKEIRKGEKVYKEIEETIKKLDKILEYKKQGFKFYNILYK